MCVCVTVGESGIEVEINSTFFFIIFLSFSELIFLYAFSTRVAVTENVVIHYVRLVRWFRNA